MNRRLILLFSLLLAAGILRLILAHFKIEYNLVVSMFYIAIYSYWMYEAHRRFSQKSMCMCINAIGMLMIFWMGTKLIKYALLYNDDVLWRCCKS